MPLPIPDSAVEERAGIRAGDHVGPTSGLAPGFAQANLAMLPGDLALDFLRFCVRNPKPCPLLEVTDTGSARPATWRETRTCEPIFPATGSSATGRSSTSRQT